MSQRGMWKRLQAASRRRLAPGGSEAVAPPRQRRTRHEVMLPSAADAPWSPVAPDASGESGTIDLRDPPKVAPKPDRSVVGTWF